MVQRREGVREMIESFLLGVLGGIVVIVVRSVFFDA